MTNETKTEATSGKKKQRIVSPEVSAALAKAREDDSCDETFSNMLGAAYAAAKALRDVPGGARVSVGNCELTEEQVEAFADAFEVKVSRQVAEMPSGLDGPRIIYSFHGVYEAALSGGKHDVFIDGQGSRLATVEEAREHGVRVHDEVTTLTGDEAVSRMKGGAR